MEDLENIGFNEVIIKDLVDKNLVVFLICREIANAKKLSGIIKNNSIGFESYTDIDGNVVFEIKINGYTMRWNSEKKKNENAMYERILNEKPDYISVGYRSNGHYHLDDNYKLLVHS